MSSLGSGPCVEPGVRTLCPARGPWWIWPHVRPRQIRPPGPALVDPARPRRIQPQVLTSNFLLALVPGSGPGLDRGSVPRAGHRVWTPGWTQDRTLGWTQGLDPRLDTGSEPQAGHCRSRITFLLLTSLIMVRF